MCGAEVEYKGENIIDDAREESDMKPRSMSMCWGRHPKEVIMASYLEKEIALIEKLKAFDGEACAQ